MKSKKSEEKHKKILELIAKRKMTPKAARRGVYLLSDILSCGKCGHSMQFTLNGTSKSEFANICQCTDHFGNRCRNRGSETEVIIEVIFNELKKTEELVNKTYEVKGNELELLRTSIEKRKGLG